VDQLGEDPPPPSLAPYAVDARTAPARAREPVLRLSPPPATWDVGEASSSASVHPIVGRQRSDLEEEAELARALATAAAKKRREEETAAAVAAVELFKQQEELEAYAWVEGDGEVATGEGDAEAEVIVVDSDEILVDGEDDSDYELAILAIFEDAASFGELSTNYASFFSCNFIV
jgi:hypothetical protein